jgi:hypothetical protein
MGKTDAAGYGDSVLKIFRGHHQPQRDLGI